MLEEYTDNVERIDLLEPESALIGRAAGFLRDGHAVIFPTDTVYGVGVAAGANSVPDVLFEIKHRERAKTIPWLVGDRSAIDRFGRDVPAYARRLADAFWPGDLTVVVRASDSVPAAFNGPDGTIALRMPDSPVALALIAALGTPLAATSANLAGGPAVNDAGLLDPELVRRVPLVLDGGAIEDGQPSTIVLCLGDEPQVIREGGISAGQVRLASLATVEPGF